MKRCNRCRETLVLARFPKNAASRDGYYSLCKSCRAAQKAEYRQRPGVLARERARLEAAYVANKPVLLEKRKARYAANKAHERAKNREWRSKNLERHRALCRDWARANPEAMRALVAKRRAAGLSAEGKYTASDIAAMRLAQDGKCNCCRVSFGALFHVDHMVPLSRGGSNWPDNLQLLCIPCNLSKGDKLPHEFEAYRAAL